MRLADCLSSVPEHARDLRINLERLLQPADAAPLDARRAAVVALAAALAARHRPLTDALERHAGAWLDGDACRAVQRGVGLVTMGNVYHRAVHQLGGDYAGARVGLRNNSALQPGLPRAEFALVALAVSALNGCAACLQAHEAEARAHGLDREAVLQAIRIAAVVQALAVMLEHSEA